MATHRKPRRKPRSTRPRSTAWASLALAGAATATAAAAGAGAHAEPRPTTAQIKAKVDRLHHEAEEATEKYNGATEQAKHAEKRLGTLRDRAARKTAALNAARDALGSHATAQYRSGAIDPTVQLALSSAPEQFLRRAATANRAGTQQARALGRLRRQLRVEKQVRSEAAGKAKALKSAQRTARQHKRTIQGKLKRANELLDQLTTPQREKVLAQDGHGEPEPKRSSRGAGPAPAPAPTPVPAASSRAAEAIAYARSAIGKPYVWGATGPNSYDCSGLTQAAWKAAGVSLPRTTYTQVNAGQRVSRNQLTPGDLVFFYSGLSHVGLYIGDGKMIHAPRPGTSVRVAPITEMPFNTAVRPA